MIIFKSTKGGEIDISGMRFVRLIEGTIEFYQRCIALPYGDKEEAKNDYLQLKKDSTLEFEQCDGNCIHAQMLKSEQEKMIKLFGNKK